MDAQEVALLDKVCWFFPELRIVMRHGGEPWVDLAVKLMVKWPNLYYSTSAFAPKYYPQAKSSITPTVPAVPGKRHVRRLLPVRPLARAHLPRADDLPFRDEAWPKFLRDNAREVLGLP